MFRTPVVPLPRAEAVTPRRLAVVFRVVGVAVGFRIEVVVGDQATG